MTATPFATVELARQFTLAGNARLTVVSARTGQRFTYRVRRSSDDPTLYFVALRVGAEHLFIGTLRPRTASSETYRHGRRAKVAESDPGCVAARWFFPRLLAGTVAGVEIWHEGACGRCGRPLTVPESIERGIGPDCAAEMAGSGESRRGLDGGPESPAEPEPALEPAEQAREEERLFDAGMLGEPGYPRSMAERHVAWAGAPGTGRIVWELTRLDQGAVFGRVVENTIRELTPAEVR